MYVVGSADRRSSDALGMWRWVRGRSGRWSLEARPRRGAQSAL